MDDGGGCNPGAGKTGRRVTEDVVQGGGVIDVDDAAVVVQIRGPGPEQVDGVSEVHRRRKEEMPGEDPLFRQLPAGDTGDIASAAWSAPRHRKHAKCLSPGAREAGQEAHRGPEKDLAPGALSGGPEEGRLSKASPEPLPPAWEIRFVEVILMYSRFSADKHKC